MIINESNNCAAVSTWHTLKLSQWTNSLIIQKSELGSILECACTPGKGSVVQGFSALGPCCSCTSTGSRLPGAVAPNPLFTHAGATQGIRLPRHPHGLMPLERAQSEGLPWWVSHRYADRCRGRGGGRPVVAGRVPPPRRAFGVRGC